MVPDVNTDFQAKRDRAFFCSLITSVTHADAVAGVSRAFVGSVRVCVCCDVCV